MTADIVWLRPGMENYANEIRSYINNLGWSQREAARQLELDEGAFRAWCRGYPCPRFVVLALHYLVFRESVDPEKQPWT